MTVKSEVQGIVQALFGAYAGGYLAELTAEATANGSSAVAARLVTIQGVILGRNMSDNQDFVDTILSNMGVPSTNGAYEAAAAWAMGELTAGASRADIVSAAVAFLDGIAAGTIVDSKYTAIAEAFAATVEAGIEYSEDAGEEEFSLATLQAESGIAAPFNLTAALATLSAANDAVDDYLTAWGEANEVEDAEADDVDGAATAAAEALDESIADSGAGEAEDFINANDNGQAALIAAATALFTAEIAADQAALDAAQADIDDVEGLQDLIDASDAADAAAEEAQAALDEADGDLAAALAYVDTLDGDDTLVLDAETGTYFYDDAAEGEDGFDAEDTVVATIDAESEAYVAGENADGEAWTDDDVAGLTDLIAALNVQMAAEAADAEADTAAEDALADVAEAAEGDGDELSAALDDANEALTASQAALTALEENLAAFEAAASDADALAALVSDVDAAAEAIAIADYDLNAEGYESAEGEDDLEADFQTAETEVIFLQTVADAGEAAEADGLEAGDIIALAGFTANDGEVDTDGDNSVLEFFITENDDGDVVLQVEIETWSSNSVGDAPIELTLVGVAIDDITVHTNYITIA